jgi:HEAT repeat protein
VLNGADGWPGKAELECKSVAVTENVNRRTGLKITWERLEGAERDTALAPPPPVRPPTEPTPAQDLAKIEQRLRSDQAIERELAANELNNARIQDPSPDFMALMVKLSGERNDTVRQAAIGVIAKHGTAEQVPLLVKALKDPANASSRQTIARGLGRLKDPRGADPLAEMMALGVGDNTSYRSPRDGENFWVEALVEIGPASEKAVLPLLKEKSIDTRIQVCAVLKQVGTRRSLADLKDLTASPSKELSEAAAEAVRSIQAKESK